MSSKCNKINNNINEQIVIQPEIKVESTEPNLELNSNKISRPPSIQEY